MPGFDTNSTLKRILSTGKDYSWFVLTQKIIEKEFALSGSEQNHDLTSKKWLKVLKARLGKGATPEVEAFKEHGEDFVVANNLEELVAGMNRVGTVEVPLDRLREQIEAFRFSWEGNTFSVSASIGIVPITNGEQNLAKLLSTADMACYMAKKDGRNRVHAATPDDQEIASRRGES